MAALAAIPVLLLGGCATRGTTSRPTADDPLETVNRAVYRFNDFADRVVLRPLAVGYTRALPPQIRTGVFNFFDNALYPLTIVNDVLQGKFRQGGRDLGRFTLNSTVGLLGLFDPASDIGLGRHDEDFGQTLAVWGVGNGPYLMVPIFGPYTLRDGFGALLDAPLTPFFDVGEDEGAERAAAYLVYSVDKRSRLLDVDEQVRDAFDPYVFVRDTYYQNRDYRIKDGNVDDDELYLDEEEFLDDDTE
jgi:phospholipid-binding lipoprotein MlaA